MAKPKVFIGVGHGGVDVGAVGCNGVERDINLVIATELKSLLNKSGVRAKRSRKSNKVQDTVQDEVKECNEYKPDLCVEIHMNASGTHRGYGFECWISTKRAESFAKAIEKQVINGGQYSRGIKTTTSLYFLNHTKAPAVILEGAFVDNKTDKKWCTKKGSKELAYRYYLGIMQVLIATGKVSREMIVKKEEK